MAAVRVYVLLFTAFFFSGLMQMSMAQQDKPAAAAARRAGDRSGDRVPAHKFGEVEEACSSRPMWKKLWSANVPPKVKHFVWKAATNSLATKLLKKKTPGSYCGQCPCCGMEEETFCIYEQYTITMTNSQVVFLETGL
ncbi:hypothetical protein EJB05_16159, partial [Eragrostis curvula]